MWATLPVLFESADKDKLSTNMPQFQAFQAVNILLFLQYTGTWNPLQYCVTLRTSA